MCSVTVRWSCSSGEGFRIFFLLVCWGAGRRFGGVQSAGNQWKVHLSFSTVEDREKFCQFFSKIFFFEKKCVGNNIEGDLRVE